MAYNKNELVRKIQSLQELSNEEKSALLELLRTHKKYGLVWEDKPEEVEERLRSELPVLKEVKERAIISDDPDAPNHILIEGDNLEALVALTYTHAGKIDFIYIDPPYNTGNKDFVYNDVYVDKENAFRHSSWLSFMKKRLVIAQNLLSDRGIILLSIDDNEQAALTLLCDEIFGAQNRISVMPRITKASGKTTDKIALNHDYLLLYAKINEKAVVKGLPHDDQGFRFEDEHVGTRGKYKLNQTLDYDSLSYSSGLDYPIEIEGKTLYPGGSYEQYLERKKGNHKRADWAWRWSPELYQFGLKNGFVVLKSSRNGFRIYTKTYQYASISRSDSGAYFIEYKDRTKPIQSIHFIENQFSNDNAKKELSKYFSSIPFDYPKPTSIVREFLKVIPEVGVVLDFFAGSGTTMDATLLANSEDGERRRCILVTNNENNICEEVTYERNRRIIKGYTTPRGNEVEGLTSNSLRYYKTGFVGRERTSKGMRDLMYASTELLCIKNDLYPEVQSLSGKKLNSKIARYFDDSRKRMLVIYNEEAIPAIAELIATMDYPGKMMVYVFSPGNYPYEDEFVDVRDKVELCALPAAIYNAYRKVLPRKKVVELPEAEDDDTSVDDVAIVSDSIPSPEGQLNLNFGE